MSVSPHISLRDVTIGYKSSNACKEVLAALNLEFNAGEFIALVGLNGTGKSTLLKSMSGLLPLIKGNISINGKSIDEMEVSEIATKVAVVLTEKISGFNLTVFDVVATGQLPYTNSFHAIKDVNRQVIHEAINTVGLQNYEHTPLNQLSDGLFQKTMIAKALAQQTPAIILDEPTAFLDYASKHELFILLQKQSLANNKCIIASTHDLDLALKYCNKIAIAHNHKIHLIETREALKNEAFLQVTGGYIQPA